MKCLKLLFNHYLFLFAMLMVSLVMAVPSFAEMPTLPKNSDGYFIINTDEDYETFRKIVAYGNPYANAVLTNDIKAFGPVGEWGGKGEQSDYRGTFDGQGHFIDCSIERNDASVEAFALFQYTKPGCVIRNLGVSGFIKSNAKYVASIVGDAMGTRLENCVSSVNLTYSDAKETVQGGLIGIARGVCFLENCAFTGYIGEYTTKTCGVLVGENTQGVDIKSCYSAGHISSVGGNSRFVFANKLGSKDIALNNYYCVTIGNTQPTTETVNMDNNREISKNDIESGKLCYMLNQKGRKGMVWYQTDSNLYPFKRNDDQKIAISTDGGETISFVDECTHNYAEHICTMCGGIEDGAKIDPVQYYALADSYHPNQIIVDRIRYKLNESEHTATVTGLSDSYGIYGAHIPESIRVNGEDYTVTYITGKEQVLGGGFEGGTIAYCYIPKTVKRIENYVFTLCRDLRLLYVADGDDSTEPLEFGYYNGWADNEDSPMFKDTQLQYVYFGRNISWDPTHPAPFKDVNSITDVFWGPAVTRVGNAFQEDARVGNYELFAGLTAVKRLYFMGRENTLDNNLDVLCGEGMGHALDVYINRNLAGDYVYRHTRGAGATDLANTLTFGPWVKTTYKVAEFIDEYTEWDRRYVSKIDFSRAYNLETIESRSFSECGFIQGTIDLTNTKVKRIGERAFFRCDQLERIIFNEGLEFIDNYAFSNCSEMKFLQIPASVNVLGDEAFIYCNELKTLILDDSDNPLHFYYSTFEFSGKISNCYVGRTLKGAPNLGTEASCHWTIGPKAKKVITSMFGFGTKYDALHILPSDNPLMFEATPGSPFATRFKSLFIDRQILYYSHQKANIEPADIEVNIEEYSPIIPIIRESIHSGVLSDVTFGNHYKEVPDNLFEGANKLKYVVLPASVTSVGENAFKNCSALEMVSIMGSPEIKASAFAGCGNLSYVYMMGESIKLGEKAFGDSNKMKELFVNFSADPGVSAESAFHNDAYQNTHLLFVENGGPDKYDFVSTPWTKFKNTSLANSKYYGSDKEPNGLFQVFQHAQLPREFKADCYDMVYLPFDVDSYYFGSDAIIYRMDMYDSIRFWNELTTDDSGTYDINSTLFTPINIDEERTLAGSYAYLIKPKHDDYKVATYFNFYEKDDFRVLNIGTDLWGREGNMQMRIGADWEPFSGYRYYTFNDGVIKCINGELTRKAGDVFLHFDPKNHPKATVYDFVDKDNNLLFSSKANIDFVKQLEGYTSFYAADHNYIAPEWCDVYVVTSTENKTIVMAEVEDKTITKGQAVLLKTNREMQNEDITEYLTYAMYPSAATELYNRNLLKGVSSAVPANTLSAGNDFVYVLSCSSAGKNTGFYKLSGDRMMPVGKAYLDPNSIDMSSQARACLFICDDSIVTGITTPMANDNRLRGVYDLMGRRLKETGFRGMYIINNKKVVR